MAVNGKSRRSYRGAPVSNTLGVTLSVGATNITLAVAMAGWPTDGEPFFVVVDPGTAKEEKICVKYSTSTTLTVVDPAATSTWGASGAGRGADNTIDRQHEQGSVIYPVFTSIEANQANELVSKYANPGSVVYQGSASPVGAPSELTIGTAGQILKVNTGATAPEWGQVTAAGITDSTITLGKLATALQAFLVPVGSINAYAGATAPTGWLLCNGTSTTGYTALAALVGATTPDLRGKFALGKTASGTGSTLLGTGGTNTIGETHLPAHAHGVGTLAAVTNTTGVTTVAVGNHNHTLTDPAHSHTVNGQEATTWALSDYIVGVLESAFGGATFGEATATATTGISIAEAGAHGHTITDPGHGHTISGATANTGDGTAYFQPFLAVNYIIKHD